jgi:signal transduction histidine kinase
MSAPGILGEKLTFFGRITASLSHELKNVLATINEYFGLLDDLSRAAAAGRPLKPERLQAVCGKVSRQVARGEELIRRLNRFAHSVDEPVGTVDLEQLLTLICDLCDRFAKLKQVALERRFPGVELSVTLDSFALLYAVTLAIDLALDAATEQRVVTVALEPQQRAVRVESADPLGEPGEQPAHAALVQACAYLGAALQLEPQAVVLQLP